jgi:hypothetical protein
MKTGGKVDDSNLILSSEVYPRSHTRMETL